MYAGAPLQANPQVQVFYPLRWLFVPFAAEKGILYFAALHAWLAGAFTYALARRVGRVGALAGLAAALIFALNGWTTGLLGAPVRVGAVPWLPAAILLWELLRDRQFHLESPHPPPDCGTRAGVDAGTAGRTLPNLLQSGRHLCRLGGGHGGVG